MTIDEARLIPHGVHRIYWKHDPDRHSVASIGFDRDGKPWYAPSNWLSVPSTDWRAVERTELIETQEGPDDN